MQRPLERRERRDHRIHHPGPRRRHDPRREGRRVQAVVGHGREVGIQRPRPRRIRRPARKHRQNVRGRAAGRVGTHRVAARPAPADQRGEDRGGGDRQHRRRHRRRRLVEARQHQPQPLRRRQDVGPFQERQPGGEGVGPAPPQRGAKTVRRVGQRLESLPQQRRHLLEGEPAGDRPPAAGRAAPAVRRRRPRRSARFRRRRFHPVPWSWRSVLSKDLPSGEPAALTGACKAR